MYCLDSSGLFVDGDEKDLAISSAVTPEPFLFFCLSSIRLSSLHDNCNTFHVTMGDWVRHCSVLNHNRKHRKAYCENNNPGLRQCRDN